MRAVLRRDRRRRNLLASQSNPLPLPHHALVEHSNLLEPGPRPPELHTIITGDRFLAEGLRHSPAPLCYYPIVTNTDDALLALTKNNRASIIVDMDRLAVPVMSLIEQLRTLRIQQPEMQITLLTLNTDRGVLDFLHAACQARFIDKRLPLNELWEKLQRYKPLGADRERTFSHKEWRILQQMTQGYSLRVIAQNQQQPYHRVTYRIARILARLNLQRRLQLIQLLQRVSDNAGRRIRD